VKERERKGRKKEGDLSMTTWHLRLLYLYPHREIGQRSLLLDHTSRKGGKKATRGISLRKKEEVENGTAGKSGTGGGE